MKSNKHISEKLIVALGIVMLLMACNQTSDMSPTSAPTPTLTPTPTIIIKDSNSPSPTPNRCDGLSGELEMQILIGPSDAVGLEPLAIGNIPFTVVSEGEAYVIEGGGAISYQETLEKEWGTYTVEFNLDAGIDGDCQGDEQSGILNMTVDTSGEQLVEVRSEGYQGDFPWTGSQEFNLSFPIEEGATAEGEGWVFLLHLGE